MGIRVRCPNGHKLNIKETQAGKRGICPRCGAGFTIPAAEGATASTGTEVKLAAEPVGESLDWPSPALRAKDPLAEMPEAFWYVRPPSGGQFGPAPAELMRTWLAEGRITADSFVWRDDWKDWAWASETFVELAAAENQAIRKLGETIKPSLPQTPGRLTEPTKPTKPIETTETTEPRRPKSSASNAVTSRGGPEISLDIKLDEEASNEPPSIAITLDPNVSTNRFARRRSRRRTTNLVVALTVTVLVLGIVLVLVVMSR